MAETEFLTKAIMKNIQKLAEGFIKEHYENRWGYDFDRQKDGIRIFATYLTEHLKPVEGEKYIDKGNCCEKCIGVDSEIMKTVCNFNFNCPCHKDKGEEKKVIMAIFCPLCSKKLKVVDGETTPHTCSPQPKETKEIEELRNVSDNQDPNPFDMFDKINEIIKHLMERG